MRRTQNMMTISGLCIDKHAKNSWAAYPKTFGLTFEDFFARDYRLNDRLQLLLDYSIFRTPNFPHQEHFILEKNE